jgi:CRISPR-associated endonuclease Cas3-HD
MGAALPFAHSKNSWGVRHDLVTHLTAVAELAAAFADALSAPRLAYYAGLWHDVGKFRDAFQQYLRTCEASPAAKLRGPDHKAAGAKLAADHIGLAALAIQGHHGGLASREQLRDWLAERANDPDLAEALDAAARAVPALVPAGPLSLPPHVERDPRAAEFFVRMLFSALVDANYLDTERHFQPDRSAAPGGMPPGFYRTATGVTEAVLGGRDFDANDPALASAYFKRLFDTLDTDRERIQEFRHSFNYPEVSARFRMIDDDTESVVVGYGSADEQRRTSEAIELLRRGTPDGRHLIRQIQPYLVPVRTYAANKYRLRGLIREVAPGIGEWRGAYDPVRGLVADDPALTDLII